MHYKVYTEIYIFQLDTDNFILSPLLPPHKSISLTDMYYKITYINSNPLIAD